MAERVPSRVALLAYKGTEGDLLRLWEDRLPESESVRVFPVDPDYSLTDILAHVITDEDVAEDFVLVPANCLPCSRVTFEELCTACALMDSRGGAHLWNRLPVRFSVERLMEFLPANDGLGPEQFLAKWYEWRGVRPEQVSFHWGNHVCPVYRANPCEHVIIEAFIKRRFVTAAPEGWPPVLALLNRLKML